jgi:type IV secretion system protein TrbL
VLLAFFMLAIQLFVTLIEFKLTTLAGFVLIPFGLFGKTAFAAERVLGNVISSGIKVLVLAVIVGIGSTLFSQFTVTSNGNQPTIEGAMTLVLAALSLLGLGLFGPGIANGLVSGGPQLGAGAAAGAALAAGGVVVAGTGLAAGSAGLASSAVTGGVRAAAALRGAGSRALRGSSTVGAPDGAASVASPLRQAAKAESSGAQAAGQPESGGSTTGAPLWAQRLKAAHTVHQGVSTTTQAVRSAEQSGQGNAVDLSEGKS